MSQSDRKNTESSKNIHERLKSEKESQVMEMEKSLENLKALTKNKETPDYEEMKRELISLCIIADREFKNKNYKDAVAIADSSIAIIVEAIYRANKPKKNSKSSEKNEVEKKESQSLKKLRDQTKRHQPDIKEINTQLNIILKFVNKLNNKKEKNAAQQKYVVAIAAKAIYLVNKIKKFSKIPEAQYRPALNKLVDILLKHPEHIFPKIAGDHYRSRLFHLIDKLKDILVEGCNVKLNAHIKDSILKIFESDDYLYLLSFKKPGSIDYTKSATTETEVARNELENFKKNIEKFSINESSSGELMEMLQTLANLLHSLRPSIRERSDEQELYVGHIAEKIGEAQAVLSELYPQIKLDQVKQPEKEGSSNKVLTEADVLEAHKNEKKQDRNTRVFGK